MTFWTLLAVLAIACLLPIFAKKSDNDKVTAGSICENELGQCMVKEDEHQCMLPLTKLDCPDGMQCCKTIIPKDYEAAGLPLKGKASCKPDKRCTKVGGNCISSKQYCEGTENGKLCRGKSCKCCYVSLDDINKKLEKLSSEMANNNKYNHCQLYCALNYQMVFKDSCYFISSSQETWWVAQEKCVEKGGNLVKIDDDEEFSFLQDHVTEDTWIGLSDTIWEGFYQWVADGSSLSTHSPWWGIGEPNSAGDEDCVKFYTATYPDPMMLNDAPCSIYPNVYICEMACPTI